MRIASIPNPPKPALAIPMQMAANAERIRLDRCKVGHCLVPNRSNQPAGRKKSFSRNPLRPPRPLRETPFSMKIVVAYSGGLDTSVLLTWLKETYSAEIVAFCADVGQEEELDGLEEKALKTGASKCFIDDLREEFARDFIFPMMQAGAIYEGQYLLGTCIARPLIAKRMVDIAKAESADAVGARRDRQGQRSGALRA